MTRLWTVTVAVFAAAAFGTESISIDRIETQWSPWGNILIQHCWLTRGGEQIWIAERNNFGKRKLLFTTGRSAEILFSDDEEWLIINHYWGSNGSSALLFKKAAPLDYCEKCDLTGDAWDFFCKQQHITDTGFDHAYVDAIRWTTHPLAVILELHGHLDPRHRVDKWFCIYYVDSKKFSTDFDVLNKEQVVLPDKR